MSKPIIYYDNAMRNAQTGDDGTVYATCAKGVAHPGDDFRILGNITLRTDLGGIYTGLPGLQLKFDDTGNRYNVIAQSDSVNVLPASRNWLSMADDGSTIVALADTATDKCATSTDGGITWVERTLPASRDWRSVAYGNGVFVAVAYGTNKGARSTDGGANWAEFTCAASRNWISVAWNGAVFCALAYELTNKCQTSPTGESWTEQTMATISGGWCSLAWNGSVFCAITAAGPTDICNTSPDGATWTAKNMSAGRTGRSHISWTGSNFVVVISGSDKAETSPTGETGTWTERTMPASRTWRCSASNVSTVMAVASGPTDKGAISIDNGATWSEITLPTSADRYFILAYSGLFITPQYGGDDVHMTYDGVTWPTRALSLFERLQTVDLNDGFTIKAGLTCAQQDTTRIAAYAADNALSPVSKGLTNTGYYLRAHLPNMLKDGGFESGAFLPNWTAEATNPWVIESTTELEGSYSASWDLVASKYLRQSGTEKLEKGVTYRLLYKGKSVTANPTAGAVTINLFQTTSGTAVDSDVTGTTPAITTSSTWFTIDFTPDFTTDAWYLNIAGDSTKANGATEVTLDEFYLYKKPTVDSLIIGRHNLVGKTGLVVKSYKMSPLRSTVGADDYTEIKASFTVDTADVYAASLTSASDPVYEIYIPAVSGFAPEIGDIYIGSSYQFSKYPQAPLDPYRTNNDGLREVSLQFRGLAPSLRTTTIKDLLTRLRSSESVWLKIGSDDPLMMTSPRSERQAPYNPYAVDLDLTLIEII